MCIYSGIRKDTDLDSLTMLVIADQHYVHAAGRECTMPERIGRHALEWTQRAIEEATRIRPPDVIVLLGDIVDNGFAAGAEQDMAEFATVVKASGVSVVVVPGNHDVAPERVFGAFGDFPGRHCINDYILYSFADNYGDDDTPVRHPDAIKQFLNEVKDRSVITLQHPPLYLAVDCTDYPFTPSNTAEIMAAYSSIKSYSWSSLKRRSRISHTRLLRCTLRILLPHRPYSLKGLNPLL